MKLVAACPTEVAGGWFPDEPFAITISVGMTGTDTMTEHGHLPPALSEYLEGELSLSERQSVQQHLTVCVICRQELRALRRTVDALRRLPRETTPTDFMAKLNVRIARHEVKSQDRPAHVPAPPPARAALVWWVFDLGRFLFFPLPTRIPLYLGVVVLGLATVWSRTSPEHTTATRGLPAVSAPPRSEAVPRKMASTADETIRAVAAPEFTAEQHFSPPPPPPSSSVPLNGSPALVWRVTGSEPAILRQQVKALASQKAEAIVVREEERLLVISLPTTRLLALRQELNTLGTTRLPEADIVPNTPTTVVHIEFIRSPSVVTPPGPAQLLPGRS